MENIDNTLDETMGEKTLNTLTETNHDEQTREQVTNQENNQQTEHKITVESTKTTLAPRPWSLGAVEVVGRTPDGGTRPVWVAAVLDANGRTICCGDSVDMCFILKMENSYDQICKMLGAVGTAVAGASDVLADFECRKTKSFKFN